MSPTIKALVIGAGRIGATFDKPDQANVITHAHAFSVHPGFELVGLVDPDIENGQRYAQVWNTRYFSSVNEAFATNPPDVVSIASPDETHASILQDLGERPLKFVFCEKPLTHDVAQARSIIDVFTKKGIRLGVNYSRRFVPELRDLRERLLARDFGDFIAGNALFVRGTVHNGSHVVDLIRFLLGEIYVSQTLARVTDYQTWDPTSSAELKLTHGGGSIFMRGLAHCPYAILELDLLFKLRRVRIGDSGFVVEEQHVIESPLFPGFTKLGPTISSPTSFADAMKVAVQDIFLAVTEQIPFPCRGEDGLRALEICTCIQEQAA